MAEGTTRARRAAFYAVMALVLCGHAIALVELLGLKLRSVPAVLAVEAIVVIACAVVGYRRGPAERRELAIWPLIGLGVWAVWGALYYGAAAITVPGTARVFDDFVLEGMPLRPAFTPIYLGVHAFSLLPYCVLPEPRLLRRYMLGNLLLLGACAIGWVTLPVRLDHSPALASMDGFGAELLRFVYAIDRTTNCFPSANTAITLYAAIALRKVSRGLFWWGFFTAALVTFAVMYVRQHYLADTGMGNMLAALMAWAVSRPRPGASSPAGKPRAEP
jgi:hypothetical protein